MNARQPIRFIAVGTAGYAANLFLFAALQDGNLSDVVASLVAYLTSNALMYLGNRYVTFGSAGTGFWRGYLRYGLVGVLVAMLNAMMLTILVRLTGLPSTPAAALSILLCTPVAYSMMRRIVFESPCSTCRLGMLTSGS